MTPARRTGAVILAAASLLAPIALAGGAAGASRQAAVARQVTSSTLSVAFPIGEWPTSVFPFYTANQCTTTNIDYWNLTTRPGYWFGLGKSVALQPALSVLNPAAITTTGANTTVSLTVKGWTWSNGTGGTETMTAQDVAFFLNMDKAQVHQGGNAFCGYTPGIGLPDQVVSVSYPDGLSGTQVNLVFAGHPDHQWLLDNELGQIVPLATAWDTTGSGFAGCSTEAFSAVKEDGTDTCTAVFTYLSGLRGDDALWSWADGPYRQQSFGYSAGNPSGEDVQVANADYSGPQKAQAVQRIVYVPDANIHAEIQDLQSNKLDIGVVDTFDVSRSPGPGRAGHNLLAHMGGFTPEAGVTYGVFYWMFNFDNAHSSYQTTGPLPTWAKLNNLQYFRAAMQASEDQPYVIDHVDNGYGTSTYSAIPSYPKDSLNAGVINPYPYSTTRGKALMRAHGWNTKHFPDVCDATNCGNVQFPIPKGTKASIRVSGIPEDPALGEAARDEAASIKTTAGIQVVLTFPIPSLVPGCPVGWEICGIGGWIYQPDYYPSGETLFVPGSASNLGGYDSAEMNALVSETTANGDLALNAKDPTYHTSFAQWSATDAPFLWQPTPSSIVEVAKSLRGEQPENPLGDFNPEYIAQI